MKKKIVLIGASTGGPSQIKKILANIISLSSIVVIVQHMKEEILPFFIKDLQNSIDAKESGIVDEVKTLSQIQTCFKEL
ncbi:chemotaxis protein CheB [Sulfurimonas sp.]|uniref:chemotaxis protein CheB n=1 Tax=Sulfurimonas sp. TaxID=2022749 RepID=UPI002AAF9B84|nr:chemotaxis protein CheB [Sulfurimonas sp.]